MVNGALVAVVGVAEAEITRDEPDDTVIPTLAVEVLLEESFAVTVAVYDPAVEYTCDTDCPVKVTPSPKFQL